MSVSDSPDTPCPSRSSANCTSHSTASASISATCRASSSSNRSGSSRRTVSTTSNANAMCIDSSRNTQLVPEASPLQQPAGAQEVDVGEGAVEEQPLDAGGEADQVEQERPPVGAGPQLPQVEDRVDPAEAELGLAPDRGDVLDGGERGEAFLLVGHVGVEQVQIELDVHGLLEQLPGQVEPALRGVDVLVEVEHQVVGDDGVAGGEERHQPGRPGAARPARAVSRSARSECRSTSSTVQVLRMASWNRSKKCG